MIDGKCPATQKRLFAGHPESWYWRPSSNAALQPFEEMCLQGATGASLTRQPKASRRGLAYATTVSGPGREARKNRSGDLGALSLPNPKQSGSPVLSTAAAHPEGGRGWVGASPSPCGKPPAGEGLPPNNSRFAYDAVARKTRTSASPSCHPSRPCVSSSSSCRRPSSSSSCPASARTP